MTWEEITKELFEEKTTKRFIQPYKECRVIKNTQTGETATYYDTEDGLMLLKWLNNLSDENEQLKQELKIYRKIANCSNCEYQNYDWYDDGDEFEICERGNNEQQIEYHICEEWSEL